MLIDRPSYIDRLLGFRDPELVKILVGVRRSGKSTLLQLLRQRLLNEGANERAIISINYERADCNELRNPAALHEYLDARDVSDKDAFLFIDEVQELGAWGQTINSLRATYPLLDIFVTCSNARMFMDTSLTYLSGRYVKIDVYPLSLPEYVEFKNGRLPNIHVWREEPENRMDSSQAGAQQPRNPLQQTDYQTLYESYLQDGAFPAVALSKNPELTGAIIDGLFDSVFTRDILFKGGVRDEEAFLRVAHFVLDNIGNMTSPASIRKALANAGHKVSENTIDRYINLMMQAYLIYHCERYDVRGKKRLSTNGKYYAVDQGLRRRVIGSSMRDRGHITENLVFLELKRRGYEVFCGSLPKSEIDFVASKNGVTAYVQVAETVADPAVLDRELEPFSQLRDRHRCVLVTKDFLNGPLADGVEHRNLYRFLLGAAL